MTATSSKEGLLRGVAVGFLVQDLYLSTPLDTERSENQWKTNEILCAALCHVGLPV